MATPARHQTARAEAADPALPSTTATQVQPVLAVALNRPLIGHLQHLAQHTTAGDFETLVIWGELVHRSLGHLLGDLADPQALLRVLSQIALQPGKARAVPLHDLVDASGIPRETVRRKLDRLARQGHARRTPAGWQICANPGRVAADSD